MVTCASPAGHARARSRSSECGVHSSTDVVSSTSNGHDPTEWWSREPTAGQVSSTSRIRVAPTTHSG